MEIILYSENRKKQLSGQLICQYIAVLPLLLKDGGEELSKNDGPSRCPSLIHQSDRQKSVRVTGNRFHLLNGTPRKVRRKTLKRTRWYFRVPSVTFCLVVFQFHMEIGMSI